MKKSEKRRVLLINPRFQITFTAYMAVLALGVLATFYVANVYYFSRFQAVGFAAGLPADHQYFRFYDEQQRFMNWVFLVTSMITFVAILVGGLFLSHRVAGPLYHLVRHLEAVNSGQTLEDVKFRKKDFFPEVATSINEHLRRYRDAIKR